MAPGETLAHYRIAEPLGSGGMGEVYRAEDLRLRRSVALKTLRVQDGDEGTARLLAEARAASALNHPHIAVVYEIGHATSGGSPVDYIAMEYVEGITLAALAAGGPIPLDRILDIFEQIADALEEAERHGIVHRDLKPANVMITPSGRVKVLDFGIAQRAVRTAIGPDEPTHTAGGADVVSGFAGTVPYAAPEQMAGREVDGRADLFSLGVMLYELVAGRRPFDGANAAQVLEAMLTQPVPRLPDTARDARLPEVDRLAAELLERDRDQRLGTAAGLRARFAGIRTGAAANTSAPADGSTLVIAGFANISGGGDDDWVGAGIAETLTTDAAQLEGIAVVPRDRVSQALKTLRQQTGDTDDRLFLGAARTLKARWAVLGAFQRAGDSLRVTASLVDAVTGRLIRSMKVDGRLAAIFELQDALVRELAGALRAAVSPANALPETDAVSAYEAFSRGLLNRRGETFEMLDRAVILFERAVAIDPTYARAHIELGVALSSKADYLSMPELHVRGLASLRRAVELQPGSARAWRELGATLMILNQDAEGMAALRRALAIDPHEPSVLGALGRAHFINFARFAEAVDWYERAVARNPDAGWYWLQLAHCATLMRDFDRGERAAARAVELQEAFLSGREGLFIAGGCIRAGHLAALQGRHEAAVAAFERELDFLVRTEHPLRQRILVELNARLGASYQQLGDHKKAGAVLAIALEGFERRIRLGADEPFTRYYAAAVHALRGEAEPALALLERALAQQPAFTAARAMVEPEFEPLRADPRFQRLLRQAARQA